MEAIFSSYGEYFLTTIAFCLLAGPVIHHIVWGWRGKREEVLASFMESGIKSYFDLFFPAQFKGKKNLKSEFHKFYYKRFGRMCFIIPGIVLAVTSGFMLFFASWAVFVRLRQECDPCLKIPPIALAAFAGGYVWVLFDLSKRAHQRDMRPPHLLWATFRLFVSVPLGYGIAFFFQEEVGIPIAILLGLFPTHTFMTIGRRIVQSQLEQTGLVDDPERELENLQGIGQTQADRFRAERVSTIVQLAYSDPIDLTIRTNFSFSYVVDCCSQALAWLYFKSDLEKMGKHTLRGAQEIANLIYEIDGDEKSENLNKEEAEEVKEARERAEECIKTVAKELDRKNLKTFERVLREIEQDPYTKFLYDVWCAGSA